MSGRFGLVAALIVVAGALGDASADDPQPPTKVVERKVSGPVGAMVASPDGKWLAVADLVDNEVVLFSTTDDRRQVVARREVAGIAFTSVLFTDDSAFLVVEPNHDAAGACTLVVIDVATSTTKFSVDCPPVTRKAGGCLQVAPDPGGSRFLVREFSSAEVWDAKSGTRVSDESAENPALRVYRTADAKLKLEDRGDAIALVDLSRRVDGWSIDASSSVAAPKGRKPEEAIHDRHVHVAGLTQDGKFLALQWKWKRGPRGDDSFGEVRQVTVHSMKDGKAVWKRNVVSGPRAVAMGGDVVAIGTESGIEFVEAASGKDRGIVPTPEMPATIAPAADGRAFWVNLLSGPIVKVETPAAPK